MTRGEGFFARLGVARPIVQAPMAGGATTPELVAAVSEAGALGSLAGAYLAPRRLAELASDVRARTRRPFAVNLFAPLPEPALPEGAERALERLAAWHADLALPPPVLPAPAKDPFEELFAVALDSGAAVFSFTFGIPTPAALEAARRRGMLVVGTATTVAEARALEAAGVDAIVAQGSEAGAHRGTFAAPFEAALVGTVALVPQMVDAVRAPVLASGGIMDGRGIAAALALGAAGVQMGTAFLVCEESGVPEAYKAAVLAAHAEDTRVTRAITGRPARGIANRLMDETEAAPEAVLPSPLQNSLTRPLRAAAAARGRADLLSLWAGQAPGLARRGPAAVLVDRLAEETAAAIARLATRAL